MHSSYSAGFCESTQVRRGLRHGKKAELMLVSAPDNLATPLAGAIGDLLALVLLALTAHEGIIIIGTLWSTFIFLALVVFIAANVYFTLRNAYVQELIWGGWVPLLLALAVSR